MIARRLRIVRDIFGMGDGTWYVPGRLATYNLVCSCHMCRDPKWRDSRQRQEAAWIEDIDADCDA